MRTYFVLLFSITVHLNCTSPQKDGAKETKALSVSNKEVVCFVYHRFGDSRYPSTNVSLKNFEAHLQYLKENDFQVLALSDAVNYLKSDSVRQKTAVITIDDGYNSFYENGLPLLEKFGFPATLFINTETVGGNDYMNWNAIKDANVRGIEIGNHTHSHQYFLNLAKGKRYQIFEEELKLTQKLIRENVGETPEVFAYPYGEFDAKMKSIVESMGFVAAAAQNSGVIHSKSDLMELPRFPMSEFYSAPDKFASKADMKALKISSKSPESFMLLENATTPQLTMEFDGKDLQLDQLQCFVQGSECEKQIEKLKNGSVKLIVQATGSIANRRRTLYTITVPDKDGNWYWFSHLWVNPGVK